MKPDYTVHDYPRYRPVDEYAARKQDAINRAEWQETLRERRRCLLLLCVFWAGVAALIYVVHSNGCLL